MRKLNLCDDVMDPTLKEFFTIYYIDDYTNSNISKSFSMLPIEERLNIFEKYLNYFFDYAATACPTTLSYESGKANLADSTSLICFGGGDIMFREMYYNIQTEDDCEDDTFVLTIKYSALKSGHINLDSVQLWMCYDLYGIAGIGFENKGTKYDLNSKVSKQLLEMFNNNYNYILNNDQEHAWYILHGKDTAIKELLTEYNNKK